MAMAMSGVLVCGAPTQLSLASDFHMPPVKSTSSITIKWSHATCSGCTILSYTVEWGCSAAANDAGACSSGSGTSEQVINYGTPGCLASGSTCEHEFTGLSSDTAYDFRIKSTADDGSESVWSDWLQGDGQYCRTSSFAWVPDCTAACFFTLADADKVPPQPPTPTFTVVTSGSASKSVSLAFDVPGCSTLGRTPKIDSYKIKKFKAADGSGSATTASTTLSYTDNQVVSGQSVTHQATGLEPNTNYTFSVIFVNDPVESSAAGETESDAVTALTDPQEPGTFTISRHASNDTSIHIMWTKPDNYNAELEDYEVSYCAIGSSDSCVLSGSCSTYNSPALVTKSCTGTGNCRFEATGLTSRRRYRFRVQATNNPGGTTPKYYNRYTEGQPYQVYLSATATTTRYSIFLEWSRPNDCTYTNSIDEYELYIANGTTSTSPPDSMARTTTCTTPPCVLTLTPTDAACSSDSDEDCVYTHDNLQPLEEYTYFVRAQNSYGWGLWSNARTFTTDAGPAEFLTNPTTANSPPAETWMTVEWDEAEGYGHEITEYRVSVCNGQTSGSCPWNEGTVDGIGPSIRAYNWTGLSGYQPYIFRVQAKSGFSANWGEPAYTTSKKTVSAPAKIVESTIAHKASYGSLDEASNLYFEWAAPSANYDNDPANLQYEARIADFGSSSFSAAADASVTTEHTFSGLDPNTTYLVQVRAINSWDTGEWSESQELTTGGKIPDSFTASGASSSTTTNTSLRLTWVDPEWNNAPQVGPYTVTWWESSAYNDCGSSNKVAGTEDTYDTGSKRMDLPGEANSNVNLAPQTTYCFSVTATSTAGSRDSRPCNTCNDGPRAIITEGMPAQPSTPTEGSKDMYTIQVSWTRPIDYHYGTDTIDYYEVYIADGESATATIDPSADSDCSTRPCIVLKTASQASCSSDTSCNHLHSNLQPQETYSYSVRAHNPYGWSGWSDFKEITTTDGTPTFGTDAISFPGPQAPSYLVQSFTEPNGNGNNIVSYDVSISGVGCCSSDCYTNNADCCNGDWTDVSGLSVSASSGAWDHSSRSYNHSGLSSYTCYNFRVRATSTGCTAADCTGEWRYSRPKHTVDYPGVPTDVDHKRTQSGAKDYGAYDEFDTLLVAWTAPDQNYDDDAAMEYEVRRDGGAAEAAGTSQEHALTGLSPNTSYAVSVRARNSWGWGEWAEDVSLSTGGRRPSTFTWYRSTSDTSDITDTQVTINWASPDTYSSPLNGGGFTVYWCERTACPTSYTDWTSATVAEASAGNTEYTLTGLEPQTAYRFKVEATTPAGSRIACACSCTTASSCDSSGVVTEGKPATPAAPVSPDGSVGPSTIQVSWTEPEDYHYGASSITAYELNVSGTIESKGPTERSHIDSNLEPLTNRTYSVRAYNSYGWSDWSETTRVQTTSSAPTLDLDAISFPGPQYNESIVLEWTGAEFYGHSPAGYDVGICNSNPCSNDCYSQQNDGCCASSWTDGIPSANANSGPAGHTATGLSPYTCYVFRVRGKSDHEDSPGAWTYSRYKRTVDVPDQVDSTSVDHRSDYAGYSRANTLYVEWSAPDKNYDNSGALKYEVFLDGQALVDQAPSTERTRVISGRIANTSYNVQVRAQNSWGWGPLSDAKYLSTEGVRPDAPVTSVVELSNITFTVGWETPESYNSALQPYRVYWCELVGGADGSCAWQLDEVAVAANPLEYSLPNSNYPTPLTPETNYDIIIEARNGVGPTNSTKRTVYTSGSSAPDTPEAPFAGSLSSSAIQARWNKPDDHNSTIEQYEVNVFHCTSTDAADCEAEPIGGEAQVVLGSDGESYLDSGLQPLTSRQYQVRAYNTYGWSGWSEKTLLSSESSPPALDLDSIYFTATEVTNTSIRPKWRCDEATNDGCNAYGHSITNFHASRSNAGCCDNSCYSQQNDDCCDGPWTDDSELDSHFRSETFEGLEPYTCYVFRVRVRSDGFPDEPGAYTYSRYYRTVDKPATVDASTIAKQADYGSYDEATDLYVRWDQPQRRADYLETTRYEVRLDGNSTALDAGTTNEYVFSGLEPNTTHTVMVRMRNTWGWADWSNESSLVTGGQTPDGPGTRIAETTNTSLRISWEPPERYNSARGPYMVFWCLGNLSSVDSCDWQTSTLGAGDDVSQLQYELPNAEYATPLLPETDYLMIVEASNGFGRTNSTTLLVHTAGDPERPDAPYKREVTSTAIQVGWFAPEDHNATITSYQLNVSGEIKTVSGTKTRYLDDGGGAGLEPRTTRTYNVRAENAYGWSPWSALKTITTSDTAPTLPLDAISFPGPEAPNFVIMQWTEADGHGNNVTGYDVSISNEGCCSNSCYSRQSDCCSSWSDPLGLGEDARQHNFTSLNPEGYKCYVFRVRGKSDHEDSPGSWTYSRLQRTISEPGPVDSSTVVEKADYGPNYDKATHLYILWDAAPRRYDSNTYVNHQVRIDGKQATNVFGSYYSQARSFVVPNLEPNTSYQVSILSRNKWAWSDEWSENVTLYTDVGTAPEQCESLRRGEPLDGVSNVSTFRLVWAKCDDNGLPVTSHDLRVLDAAGNVIRDSLSIGDENEYIYDCGPEGPCDNNGCRCEPETTRVFQVRARNSQGPSAEWSNAVNLTSAKARGPETPTSPVQKVTNNYWFRLSWVSILWDEPYADGMPIEEYEVCVEATEQWYGEYGEYRTRGALPSVSDRNDAYVYNSDGTTSSCTSTSPRCCALRAANKKAFDVQSLKMNESRIFSVAARNGAGWSGHSESVEFFTDPPRVPLRMDAVTRRGESTVQRCNYIPVEWDDGSSAGAAITSYEILINESFAPNVSCPSCAPSHQVRSYSPGSRAADLGRYVEGTNVSIYIRTSNWYGSGEWSEAYSGKTFEQEHPPKPAPPEKADLAGVSNDTAISVTWRANTRCDDLDLAEIEVCEIGAPADQEPCSYVNTTHREHCTNYLTKSPLTPNRRYTFRVRVHNYLGFGEWSELSEEMQTEAATAETERVCERVEQQKQGEVPPTPTVRNFTWLRGVCSTAPPSEPCDADSHTLNMSWTVEGGCDHPDVQSFDASFRGSCLSSLTTVLIPAGSFSCATYNANYSSYNATISPATLTQGGVCDVEVAHLRSVSSSGVESLSSVYEEDPNATDTTTVSQPPDPPVTREGIVTTTTLNISWAAAVSFDAEVSEYLVSGDFGDDITTTELSVLIEGLAPGTDYTFQVAAHNDEGWSAAGANSTSHTLDTPYANAASSATGVAHEDMISAIFATWTLATDHGSALDAQQIRIDGEVIDLDPTATSYTYERTASGGALPPAKQHKFELRARNGLGWGEWGPASYLWTDPDVPGTDSAPVCSRTIASAVDYASASEGALVLELPPAIDHGSDVTSRQLSVVMSGSSGQPASEHDANSSSVIAVVGGMSPNTEYDVRLRTMNSLGWSNWSIVTTCTSTGTLSEVESAITVNDNDLSSKLIIPIIAVAGAILLIFCVWLVRRMRTRKSFQRKKFKQRKVEKKPTKEVDEDSVREDRLSQVMPYMTGEHEPSVDDARDINYNPVLLHQMEEEQRRARDAKRAAKGGGGFCGTSGAVKKLKLGIEKEKEDTGDGKSREGKKLDEYLAKSVGVSSDDLTKKSPKGGARTAGKSKICKAPHSELQAELDQTRAHAAARDQARAAMKKKKGSEFGLNIDVGEDSPGSDRSTGKRGSLGRASCGAPIGLSKVESRGSVLASQYERNSSGGHCNISEKL